MYFSFCIVSVALDPKNKLEEKKRILSEKKKSKWDFLCVYTYNDVLFVLLLTLVFTKEIIDFSLQYKFSIFLRSFKLAFHTRHMNDLILTH